MTDNDMVGLWQVIVIGSFAVVLALIAAIYWTPSDMEKCSLLCGGRVVSFSPSVPGGLVGLCECVVGQLEPDGGS